MQYNLNASYPYYVENNKEHVDIKTYLKINYLYFKFLIFKVLSGEEVTLPSKFGTLKVLGKKIKIKFDEKGRPSNLAPNWKATKELWASNEDAKKRKQIIWYTNDETDNVTYRYHWSKRNMLIGNKMLYSLTLSRHNKRTLSKKISVENKDYIIQKNHGNTIHNS